MSYALFTRYEVLLFEFNCPVRSLACGARLFDISEDGSCAIPLYS